MMPKILFRVFLYAVICLVMFVYVFPLLYVLNASLKTETEYMKDALSLTSSFHFQNYIDAWQKADFSLYILNSLFYTTVCTVVSLILNVFLAFPLARNYLKRGKLIFGWFLCGMFLPSATIPQFVLFLKLHLYNTRIGYMLSMIGAGGITLLLFISFIKSIPKDYDEAVCIDGGGYFSYIFKIVIPLMKPAIASMAILSAINVWNDILNAVIYISNNKLFPITKGLFVFTGSYNVQWTLRISGLVIVALPLLILYVCLQRYIIEGAIASGVKA